MKPTIITNVKTETAPTDALKAQPTVIPSGKGAAPPLPISNPKPFVVPGTIRTGIAVDANQLAKLFPGSSPEVIAIATDILSNTILESVTHEQAATWGMKDQKEYSRLVDESLKISTSSVLQSSLHHMDRLQSILNLLADAMLDAPKKGFRFWKSEKSSKELLEHSLDELTQLRQELGAHLPELKVMQSEMQSIGAHLMSLSTRLSAQSTAAHYVADHLEAHDMRGQALSQQSIAMHQLTAHIQSGMVLRQSTLHSIATLVQKIQDTVLVALPSWIEKISLIAQAKVMNDTEQYSMGKELQTLINKLT
jgi:hypothetical protein